MNNVLTIRFVEDTDRRDLWDWWNDELNLRMMYNNTPVEWKQHCKWFDNNKISKKRIITMGQCNDENCIAIWFDMLGGDLAEVGLNANPKYRGKGLAKQFMEKAIQLFINNHDKKLLIARGKIFNPASLRTFVGAGFVAKHPTDEIINQVQNYDRHMYWYCQREVA